MSGEAAGQGFLRKSFPAGTEIFRLGDMGDCAYLIDEGLVEITIPLSAGEQICNTLGPGQMFGEMALIDDSKRAGSARAVEDTVARIVTSSQILGRLRDADEIIAHILRVTLTRYRQVLSQVRLGQAEPAEADREKMREGRLDSPEAVAKLELEHELRAAIDGGELQLFYQPLIALPTGRLAGFEALMRWRSPRRGLVSPAEFIPLAEESGLVVPMCRWALREAAGALKRFHAAAAETSPAGPGETRLVVAVNVTKHQIDDAETMAILDEIASDGQISPHEMKIELTESVLMNDYARARGWISDLQRRRFKLSIDDFGTGYSSLSYLHQFGVDELKIDQSFVRAMLTEPRSMEVIKAIIGLARGLGLKVLAEGVETLEQAHWLAEAGCDIAQGYLYGRPTPETEVLEKIRARAPGFAV